MIPGPVAELVSRHLLDLGELLEQFGPDYDFASLIAARSA
jgi:hypothetical protein